MAASALTPSVYAATSQRDGAGTSAAAGATPRVEHITVKGQAASALGETGRAPGGGLLSVETAPRMQTTVTRDLIGKMSPSASALQMIQYAPGVNVATSDPFGLSDQTNITVRGLNQNEIGYLFEGSPIAESSPYASQWADAENYKFVSLAQGTVDLGSPLSNSAGGQLDIALIDPAFKRGGMIDYSYGSYKTNREFIRLDSGVLGNSGIRAFASFSNTTYGQSRGAGRGLRRHMDSKIVKEWGQDSRSALAVSYNENNTPTYLNPTLDQWKRYGLSNNYDGSFVSSTDTNYWKLQQGAWANINISGPTHVRITDHLSADLTPFFFWNSGSYGYGSTLNASGGNYIGTEMINTPLDVTTALPNGTVLAQSVGVTEQFRTGETFALHYNIAHNDLTVGQWYDNNNLYFQGGYVEADGRGDIPNPWGSRLIRTVTGRLLYSSNYHYDTTTNGVFVGDTLSLLHERLKISAGVKIVMFIRDGTNNLPGPQYRVSAQNTQPLPRLSITYQIDQRNSIFVNGSANARVPLATAYFNTYSTSNGSITLRGNPALKDEFSIQEELGYRYQGIVVGGITLFNYNFTNRNISTTVSLNNALTAINIDAGGSTVRGIDVQLGLRPWHHVSPYVSGEFLHATTDNNLAAGGDYLPTSGKTSVRSPKGSVSAGLSYDDGSLFGNGLFKWVASQYADFMNTQQIPAYAVFDASLGYRFRSFSYLSKPSVRLNLYNLGGARYLSGVNSTPLTAQTVTGVYGTRISGSNPRYYVGSPFAVMASFTTGF